MVEWVKGVLVGIVKGVFFSFCLIKFYYVMVVLVVENVILVDLFENDYF